jgi:hypothetical protein
MYVQCSFFCLPKTLEFVESTYKIELTLAIIMTTPHIRRRQNITIYLFIMKRKFKQRWSTIPQISTKQTITSEDRKNYTEHTFCICPFLVAFFAATIDGRNLIFGHKLHIGTQYRGKRFWTHQIPTSCLPKSGGIIGEH